MMKQELLQELRAEHEVVITALNFSYIVGVRGWEEQLRTFTLSPGAIDIEMDSSQFTYVIPKPADLVALYDPQTLNRAAFSLFRVALRNATSQSYEKIQAFCLGNGTRQPKWQSAAWRPFARLVRNSFSHDFVINFLDRKTGKLRGDIRYVFPSGRRIEIKNNLHGQPITGDNIPIDSVVELLDVMRDFVEKDL